MAAPKCRLDIWQPTIINVATSGAVTTAQRPAAWVKCDTLTDVTTENPPGPNPNLRRANAVTSVEIKDEMFSPRVAYVSLANHCQDFKAFDSDTMEIQHQDSDGNEIQISGSDVKTRIRRNWGPFSHFFKEFKQIRIVDLETHMVLFTGRIYKIDFKHDGQRGATVELVCKDVLEELKNISMGTMPKELHFPANTYRSTVIQSLLNLGFNYEASLPSGGANKNQTSPVSTPLSSATLALNSNDANTSTTAGSSGDTANSYSRFERSMTKPSTVTKMKPRKTGSKHILQELSRWAILEPHEDETAENAFGYDFFADPNIGSNNLLATTAPPPAMFNYFKRGNRLSATGGAGQDANAYGLTCMLPTETRNTRTGIRQMNVGETAESGNTTVDAFAVLANHSLEPGQVITIGSEQMFVKFVTNAASEGGNREAHVVRGWAGSTAASFSANTTIVENRPATALIQNLSGSFEDTKDELYTECALTYETSYQMGNQKMGTTEKTKHFEIMFVTEITGTFAWSGLDFDDEAHASDDDDPGLSSAEILTAYRQDGTTVYASNIGRIQYQSTSSVSGATNFGYIMLSDISGLPTSNYGNESYVVLKGNQTGSSVQCRLNLSALDVQTGRPSVAFAEGTERFRRIFTMTMETHENIDDIRQEVAARLGQSCIAMKRGSFNVSKAPYYWADFKVHSVSADGSTGQNLTVKSDNGTAAINVTNYGFREGMLVHKRTSDYSQIATVTVGGASKDVYGYCYDMTSDTAFKVNLTESQSFAVDDKIRLYMPVRAGDVMFVDHILATTYGEHIVTGVSYQEMPQPVTTYNTVGENEPRIRMRVGAVNRQNIWNTIAVDRLEAKEKERPNIPKGNQTFSFSGTWSYPATNIVQWTAGNLRTADGEYFQIIAGNTSDTTYGLGSNGMTGSNKYVVYLDPEGENPSGNQYHFYTVSKSSYVEDDDNIIILSTSVGDVKANAFGGPNLDLALTDGPSHDATESLHDNSATSALLKKGAQHWSTNIKFEGTDYNVARWGLSTSIGSDGAISFGDDETEVVTKHTGYTFSAGTSWVYKTVGASAVALPVVTQTYSDVTRADSDRILMATVVVDTDIGQTSPTIFPVNGNTPTISVGALAARSILATNIKAGEITTNEINFTPGNPDSTATIRAVAAATSGTLAGIQVDASKFFIGTGTFNNANTAFYVDNAGQLSLKNKLSWNGTALSIDGTLTFGGSCVVGDTGIFFPSGVALGIANIQWEHPSGGGQSAFYRRSNGNNLTLTTWGSSSSDSDNAFLLMNTWLGNTSFKVPAGHFDALTTDSFTINDSTMSLGGQIFAASDILLLTNGSSTDAQSLHTHGNLGGGSVDQTADYDWTGEHKFDRDNVGGNAYTPGLMLKSRGTPSVPPSGYGGLFVDQANGTYNLYFRTPNGTVPIVQGNSVGGSGEANEDSFRTIAVSGQSNIIADSDVDTLTFAAGSGITITTNASTDTLTITATGGGGSGSHDDPIRLSSNSSSSPTYSFSASTGSGMYWDSGVAFSNGGNTQLIIKNTEAEFHNDARPAASTSYFLGDQNTKRWRRLYAQLATDVSSDAELKENKKSITNGLEFISNLNPITFNRIESTDIEFGFTAQDMKQAVLASGYTEDMDVYSESVDDETGKTYWGIAYESLVAPLVAAIKELKDRIEVLENNG